MGALQSSYVLRAFAHHLSAIQGSRLKEEDDKPARGALALAATAVSIHLAILIEVSQNTCMIQVQYVFTTWKTGNHNAKMPFKSDIYRDVTTYWHDKSVAKMIDRGRYDKYAKIAMGHVDSGWATSRVLDDEDDVSVCDPSSDEDEADVFRD